MSSIYKIEFNDCIYFGSTKQKLSKRQSGHNFNLKNKPNQKLYQEAIKNGIDKLECILICECSDEERYLKENELIKNTTDKIVLNMVDAIKDIEKRKEWNRNYQQSEKRKEYKKIYNNSKQGKETNKKYKMTEKYKEYKKEYYKTERGKELKREYQKRYREKLKHKN